MFCVSTWLLSAWLPTQTGFSARRTHSHPSVCLHGYIPQTRTHTDTESHDLTAFPPLPVKFILLLRFSNTLSPTRLFLFCPVPRRAIAFLGGLFFLLWEFQSIGPSNPITNTTSAYVRLLLLGLNSKVVHIVRQITLFAFLLLLLLQLHPPGHHVHISAIRFIFWFRSSLLNILAVYKS